MIQNIGEIDRIIRVVVGTILLLVAYSAIRGVLAIILYVIGGILVVTGITGYCLIYKVIGISTKK